MKVNTIRYERLYNLGDYEHEKVCIEVEIGEGEFPSDTLTKIQKWCEVKSTHWGRMRFEKGNEIIRIAKLLEVPDEELKAVYFKDPDNLRARLSTLRKEIEDMAVQEAEVESFGLVG